MIHFQDLRSTNDVIDFNNIIRIINDALCGVDGDYLAKVYNSICSDNITYIGDSLFRRLQDDSIVTFNE